MELINEGKKIFGQTLEKLPHFVIFLGLLGIGVSFTTFEDGFHFPSSVPNWYIFGIGGLLIITGFATHFLHQSKLIKRLKKSTTLKFGLTTITIKIGDIQDEKGLTNDSAFVLPANTTFADDCVTDGKSALGSFFKEHHGEKIPKFNQRLKKILKTQNVHTTDGVNYAPATVLILPEEFSIKSKVILVASSIRNANTGFHTDPTIINNSVCNIFKTTSDKRINTFYFPIIGSGHGGLDITEALNLLVLCIKFHSKHFNHVKNVSIFVREIDRNKINASFLNSF